MSLPILYFICISLVTNVFREQTCLGYLKIKCSFFFIFLFLFVSIWSKKRLHRNSIILFLVRSIVRRIYPITL